MELTIALIQQAHDKKAVHYEEISIEEGRICQQYNWKSNSPKRLGLDVNVARIWKRNHPAFSECWHCWERHVAPPALTALLPPHHSSGWGRWCWKSHFCSFDLYWILESRDFYMSSTKMKRNQVSLDNQTLEKAMKDTDNLKHILLSMWSFFNLCPCSTTSNGSQWLTA